jgi:hypothetical protein
MIGICQIFIVANPILFVVAILLLIKTKIPSVDKLLWALLIFFVPFIGSISFFIWRRRLLKS